MLTRWMASMAVTGLVLAAGSASAQDPPPAPVAPVRCATVKQHDRFVRKHVWRFWVGGHGGDYRALLPSRKAVARARKMRQCQSAGNHRALLHKEQVYTHHLRHQWRFYRTIDRATPYGEWAIPSYIVSCESGGNYRVYNKGGSGASGAYQIMPGTWSNYGGRRYASDAAHAPTWAQHIIAGRIWRGSGSGAWSCS